MPGQAQKKIKIKIRKKIKRKSKIKIRTKAVVLCFALAWEVVWGQRVLEPVGHSEPRERPWSYS
jgi:hypothetical protein